MGPRLIERGNAKGNSKALGDLLPASMGPRLIERGNAKGNSKALGDLLPASMGPRLIERGNGVTPHPMKGLSHRFNGAALD